MEKLNVFETKELAAKALAEEIYQKILPINRRVNVAISGGNTPTLLFQILANEYEKRINWKKVHIFWVDERSVPPENDESNFKMTDRYLFCHIDIPVENIHRIRGEENTEKESVRYSELVKELVPNKKSIPRFDIILLGIGDDGHCASIFPDQMHLIDSNQIYESSIHSKTGQKRVTLTGNVINNCKNIYFFVYGENKADVFVRIVDGDPLLPASHIKAKNGFLSYYLDNEAARLLTHL